MPRCYSCGQYTRKPHREVDGRVERAYCDFCHAEREWKLNGKLDAAPGDASVIKPPPQKWWQKLKSFFD